MKISVAPRSLTSASYGKLLISALVINLSVCIVKAQATKPPVSPCDSINATSKSLKYDLNALCKDVLAASGGKPYTDDLAEKIAADANVTPDFSLLLPSKRDDLKRPFAVVLLRNAALVNAAKATTLNRPDQQTTAGQTVDAATSLVQKTAGPEILSLALESGALTQATTGNTMTLSGNLEGAAYSLAGADPICFTSCSALRRFLGDINASATFTTDQPSMTSTATTTPAAGSSPPAGTSVSVPSTVGKLTGVSAKFLIVNKFDPHSPSFQKAWRDAVAGDKNYATLADTLMQANSKLSLAIFKVQDPLWPAEKKILIRDILTDLAALDSDYETFAQTTMTSANIAPADLSSYLQAYMSLQTDWESIRKQAAGTLATIQYSFAQPANQPQTHTLTGILSYAPHNSTANGLLTTNFGISLYGNTIPAGAKYSRVQYGQAAAEFDRILFSPTSTGPVNLDIAGYWQYQPSPSILDITQSNVAPGTTIAAPTQVLVGTAGSLFVAQVQLQYKNSSGLSIPLGVKWSNKTELLTGNKVGAQIGISYDFSFLSNMLNPSK